MFKKLSTVHPVLKCRTQKTNRTPHTYQLLYVRLFYSTGTCKQTDEIIQQLPLQFYDTLNYILY